MRVIADSRCTCKWCGLGWLPRLKALSSGPFMFIAVSLYSHGLGRRRTKNCNHAWERGSISRVTELQAPPEKSSLCRHDIAMEPASVCSGRKQANHGCAALGRLISFLHPTSDLATVRWIHEYDVVGPVLFQSILCDGKVAWAETILVRGARVQRKTEFCIHTFVEPAGRAPLWGFGAKMH
jgi:hypothetical protein